MSETEAGTGAAIPSFLSRKKNMQTQTRQPFLERRGCLGHLLPIMLGLEGTRRRPNGPQSLEDQGWFEVTYHRFRFARHAPAFDGYRVVHITDLHVDATFMTAERLRGVVEAINRLKADVVVITGDFVSVYQPDFARTLAVLGGLETRDGVFGVLGNHDHPAGAEWIRECLRAAHIQELNDRVQTIRRGEHLLHLVGLDDLWPTNQDTPASIWAHLPRVERLATSLPVEGTALLLVHEPDIADVAASTHRFDLQLSGHSHGGQVRLPFYGLLTSLLPPLARRYPRGLYQVEEMTLYTNRGLGVPIRLNTPPEIAVMDLSHGE